MPFGGCYLVVVTLVFRNKVTAVGINLGIVAEIQQFQFDSVAAYRTVEKMCVISL